MQRLIDADELKTAFPCGESVRTESVRATIDHMATVDAVEVVRCKDCFYSWPFDEEELKEPYRVGEWHCEFWYGEMHEDDYCSCGKRRKDG